MEWIILPSMYIKLYNDYISIGDDDHILIHIIKYYKNVLYCDIQLKYIYSIDIACTYNTIEYFSLNLILFNDVLFFHLKSIAKYLSRIKLNENISLTCAYCYPYQC
jgi:hypothetical protein